jgi:hypothetical protein
MTKPAWRHRYDLANPRVTIRLTAPLRKILDETRESAGLSYADLIKMGLEATGEVEKARQEAWRDAEEAFAIKVPCSKCGKLIIVEPDSEMHKAVIDHLKNWHHGKCPK